MNAGCEPCDAFGEALHAGVMLTIVVLASLIFWICAATYIVTRVA